MLVQNLNVRIINAATGELIRELTIDPTRDYQPRGGHPGRPKSPEPQTQVQSYSYVLTHHMFGLRGFEQRLDPRCQSRSPDTFVGVLSQQIKPGRHV